MFNVKDVTETRKLVREVNPEYWPTPLRAGFGTATELSLASGSRVTSYESMSGAVNMASSASSCTPSIHFHRIVQRPGMSSARTQRDSWRQPSRAGWCRVRKDDLHSSGHTNPLAGRTAPGALASVNRGTYPAQAYGAKAGSWGPGASVTAAPSSVSS